MKTELELNNTLGILADPDVNRMHLDDYMKFELSFVLRVMQMSRVQKASIGSANPDLWCELLPWLSMN